MRAALAFLLLTTSGALASEHEAQISPSQRYRSGSKSILGSAAFGAGFVGTTQAGTPFQAYSLLGSVAVRVVTRHGFTIEPRLGVDALLTTGSAGLYALFAARLGVGAGWAFATSQRTALTPMIAYEAQILQGGLIQTFAGFVHQVALEIPWAVFFGDRAFLEIYVRPGVSVFPAGAIPTISLGYRLGIVW